MLAISSHLDYASFYDVKIPIDNQWHKVVIRITYSNFKGSDISFYIDQIDKKAHKETRNI